MYTPTTVFCLIGLKIKQMRRAKVYRTLTDTAGINHAVITMIGLYIT